MPEVTLATGDVDDTYIDSVNTTTNYGSESYLRVGYYQTASSPIGRALIRFSLSSIPVGAYISSAVLWLYLYSENSDNNRTMRVYRMKQSWEYDEATWVVYSTGNNWDSGGADGSDDVEDEDIGSINLASNETTGEWVSITLTASKIQEMLNEGTFTNNGFLLMMDTEFRDRYTFYSSNKDGYSPQLVINYTLGRQMQSVVIF